MIFGLKALLFSAFLVLAANVLQSVYIPTLAVSNGMGAFEISLLGTFYFVGFVLGCLILPRSLHAVGHIRLFSAFASLAAISTLIISMSTVPEIWMFCRLSTGFCLAGLYMSIESWISGASDLSNRGRIISVYRIVDISGCLVGQFILFSFVELPDLLNLVVIGFLLSFLPLSLTKAQSPILADSGSQKLIEIARSVFKSTPFGLYGVTLSGFSSGIFWSLIPLFTAANKFSSQFNPVLVSCYLVGGVLSQWPLGLLSDKVDRRKIILFSSFIALTACWAINYLIFKNSLSLLWVCVLMGFVGAGSIPIYSLSVAHNNDAIQKSTLVGLSVLMLILSSLGSVLGPLTFGVFSSALESKYLLMFSAGSHTLLFLVGIYYLVTKEQVDSVNKKVFMLLSRTNSLLVTAVKNKKG